MEFKVVIPARYGSTRLPGKPLLDIGGKPMVVRVAQRAAASGASDIWVATDHQGVADAVRAHGYNCMITAADHPSGTDRIAEVAAALGWADEQIVVNVQGDEPLIAPTLIRQVAEQLDRHPHAAISTACHPIRDRESMFNPNQVKVVMDRAGDALYFSRAPIPYARDGFAAPGQAWPKDFPAYRHIGIYGYRAAFLKVYGQLQPAPIEQFEALEQLRALWHGYGITVAVEDHPPAPGVDTPDDLEQVRKLVASESF